MLREQESTGECFHSSLEFSQISTSQVIGAPSPGCTIMWVSDNWIIFP